MAVAGPPGGIGNCFGGTSGVRVVAGAEGITPPVFDPTIGKWIYFYNVADLGLEYTADCSRNSVDGCHFCEGIRVQTWSFFWHAFDTVVNPVDLDCGDTHYRTMPWSNNGTLSLSLHTYASRTA